MSSHQLINQDSGNDEHYTPPVITEMAREVLGNIDLDPASSRKANQAVKANKIFTKKGNGLTKKWKGKLWMNHPFHKGEKACKANCKKKNCQVSSDPKKPTRGHCITEDIPSNLEWISKLDMHYQNGDVTEAICITFASMSETWMIPLLNQLQCFPHGRINYIKPDGTVNKGVTKGSVITYFGPNPERFNEVFSRIGTVKSTFGK